MPYIYRSYTSVKYLSAREDFLSEIRIVQYLQMCKSLVRISENGEGVSPGPIGASRCDRRNKYRFQQLLLTKKKLVWDYGDGRLESSSFSTEMRHTRCTLRSARCISGWYLYSPRWKQPSFQRITVIIIFGRAERGILVSLFPI